MVDRRLRASGASRPSARSRLRILLTERELGELDRAVAESGAWTRSLLVAEAVHAGLQTPRLSLIRERRCRRVNVRVPAKMADDIRQLASAYSLTQQEVLRHFLSRYLTNEPWNLPEGSGSEMTGAPEKVLVL